MVAYALITSSLSALIGPRFLSVSSMQILIFLFFIKVFSELFSLLDRFCFSIMSFSKSTLTLEIPDHFRYSFSSTGYSFPSTADTETRGLRVRFSKNSGGPQFFFFSCSECLGGLNTSQNT